MTAIAIDKLSKRYGHIQALASVSFQIEAGEVIGLLGPNGAGKTTLMKILTGYLEPDEGDAFIHGIDVVGDPLAAQRRIGYLPESAPLYGEMLVQEYLDMMAAMRGVPLADRRKRVIEAIRATGLEDRVIQPIATLSKGFRQRVGIAQAIVHRPDILILDEPTTGLDPAQIAEIRTLIKQLAEKTTVLLSTHILSEVEATCERVLVIMRGELRADAKLADLRSSNAAVVMVQATAKNIRETLSKVDGVTDVEEIGQEGDYARWRVTSKSSADLCPALFDALRATPWRVGELRSEPKSLERVFRDLAARDLTGAQPTITPAKKADDRKPKKKADAKPADAKPADNKKVEKASDDDKKAVEKGDNSDDAKKADDKKADDATPDEATDGKKSDEAKPADDKKPDDAKQEVAS